MIAKIAYARLTPAARGKVDALLASDPDTLTAPDFASRADRVARRSRKPG